jgi:uncharacterized membrane protein YfcA
MGVLDAAGLVRAGIGGGLAGSIAGLASLVTYPALLAVGCSPIAANVTNTVALVWSGVGSTAGSRPELAGQRSRLVRLLPIAVAGGVMGAVLALVTPSGLFARIVPWLILAGSLVILRRRPLPDPKSPAAPSASTDRPAVDPDRPSLPLTVGAIAIYGGYFGAAAGVLLLAGLLVATSETLARANGAKNLLLGTSNLAAAVVFAVFGPVRWSVALPLAVGCLLGARLGPLAVRRLPAGPLRLAIGVLGVGLAVALGVRAY